jgi:outer membrane protein
MKNGLLIWNVALTVIAGYLLLLSFNKKAGKPVTANTITTDTSGCATFRIAYFEMDSIESNFDMVRDVKAEINKKEEEYSNQVSQLDWTYNRQYNEYAKNAKTREELEAAQGELKALSDKLKDKKTELDQDYQNFVTRQNLSIKKKIQDFLLEYNKTKNYSYIVSYEQGLFYYKDTAYNITEDVIRGLNEEYKKEKSKKG